MAIIEDANDQLPPMFDEFDGDYETVLMIDRSSSMGEPMREGDRTTKRQFVMETLGLFVDVLNRKDAQAARESAAAGKKAGGAMTYGFSSEGREVCFDDIRPDNLAEKKREIDRGWGGATYLVPAWKLMIANFKEEFHAAPGENSQPNLLDLILTDGALDDQDRFLRALNSTNGKIKAAIGLIGYGDGFEAAKTAYLRVAEHSRDIRVVDLSQCDAAEACSALEALSAKSV